MGQTTQVNSCVNAIAVTRQHKFPKAPSSIMCWKWRWWHITLIPLNGTNGSLEFSRHQEDHETRKHLGEHHLGINDYGHGNIDATFEATKTNIKDMLTLAEVSGGGGGGTSSHRYHLELLALPMQIWRPWEQRGKTRRTTSHTSSEHK